MARGNVVGGMGVVALSCGPIGCWGGCAAAAAELLPNKVDMTVIDSAA